MIKLLFFILAILVSMSAFCRPIPIEIQNDIIKYEGSKFTNDLKDPGGPTKYGWTLKTYQTICPDATLDKLKNLTRKEALNAYEDHFWVTHGTEWISNDKLAGTVLLAQINLGAYRPDKLLQQSTNELCDSHLKLDGVLGKTTIHAVNHCKYLETAYPFILYHGIYAPLTNGKLAVYKNGWRNRALNYVDK